MKQLLCALLVLTLAGCSTTAPAAEPSPMTAPPQAPPPTDPRVSEMQVLVQELLDRIEVMNARLARLEAGPTTAQVPVQVARPRPTPQPEPVQSSHPAVTPARPRPTPAPAAVSDHGTSVTAATTGVAYREALTLFGKGRINDSRDLFQKVFDAEPSGELADNALYWIGETWFVTGNYTEAIKIYQRIEREYGEQNKAPDAILKMGMAQARTGDLMLARKTYEHLIDRYPYSTAASAARGELTRVKY